MRQYTETEIQELREIYMRRTRRSSAAAIGPYALSMIASARLMRLHSRGSTSRCGIGWPRATARP